MEQQNRTPTLFQIDGFLFAIRVTIINILEGRSDITPPRPISI